MKKMTWAGGAVGFVVACAASFGAAGAFGSAARALPHHATSSCPVAVELPGNALAPATNTALAYMRRQSADKRYYGAVATEAVLGQNSRGAVATIRNVCGGALVDRTVVVEIHFPHMAPNNAAAYVTLFVARTKGGTYAVWDRPLG